MFFSFLLELRIASQLIFDGLRPLAFPIVLTTKKTLIVIKTTVKTRGPGYDEIENEVTNSETLDSETFFSQAFCKFGSFPLVLDLMHECNVISFPDVFHFLIWASSCFVAHFHISTSQKLWGNEIENNERENNKKLKLSSTNKTHVILH